MIGSRLLHYEVTALLGEGGMGQVYRATDTRLGREVAIKVLPEAFTEDEERLARFRREAQLLASLNHPNIGGIYGLEEDVGQFLVLELVPGETLAERLTRGAIPIADAIDIGTQIARALEAAHQRGVIHRDLKPANIKLTPDGTVKVLDFGLAKAWEEPSGPDLTRSPTLTAQMTREGVILGTASYMSPEQARGRTADKRADIWSFGVVLWEMLTGRKLFAGETVSDVLAAVLRADPPVEELPAGLPRGVRRVLDRCLERDPDQRLHDIADARIELTGASSEPVRSAASVRRDGGRSRSWLRAAAFGLAVAVVAAAGSLYLDRRLGGSGTESAPASRVRLDVHLGDRWISRGDMAPSYLALSPDGTQVTFVADGDLYVRSLEGLDPRAVDGTEGAACPFFSPDGSRIGFEADDRLKIVPSEGGGVRTLCPAANMRGATWSASGFIVFATGAGEIMKVPEDGGDAELLFSSATDDEIVFARWPVVLPGDRHLLFTSLGSDYGDQASWALHALSLETGERRLLLENAGAARFLPPDRLVFVRGGNDYEMAGTLFIVSIDVETAELAGTPREALAGVHLGPDAATPYFDVSRHGALLYSPTEPSLPSRRLVWVDRTGAMEAAYPEAGVYKEPRLSPDGTRVAVSESDDIRVLDLDRGTQTRITSSGNADLPIWTPDGRDLVFEVSDPDSGKKLYTAAANGGPPRPLSSETAEFPNFMSPDGRRVNFSLQATSAQWDLMELGLEEGATVEPWLTTEELEIDASLAPNGRWVAFRAGRNVVVRPYPGPGAATIVASRSGQPRWRADGRSLFFLDLPAWTMMEAPVSISGDGSAGETLSVGTPRVLFELPDALLMPWRSYDVAPDGEHFLMLLGDPKEVDPLRLVYVPDWADELH